MAYKTFKYRIYPTASQEELIQKTFGCVRFVYNYFLSDRITHYKETGEFRPLFQQDKMLTKLKNELQWLKEPDKNALQQALRNLDVAYQNFFRKLKNKESTGYPKFKRKKDGWKSYATVRSNKNGISVGNQKVYLPKVKWVEAKISREIPEGHKIVRATVTQEPTGKYFVAITTEYMLETSYKTLDKENAIGLDYSSPHFYVDSNGKQANMPHFYRDAEKRIKREQRKLSRMVPGSKNYNKQRVRFALVHEKIRNARKDWQHKESTRLANKYDYICVEDINFKTISRGLRIAKATGDNSFGQFRRMLDYKLQERGKVLITIDKWFPSSKTCCFCGYVFKELKLGQSDWVCPSCGSHLQRDENAAINIRNQGLLLIS